jgi:hypothetical protein
MGCESLLLTTYAWLVNPCGCPWNDASLSIFMSKAAGEIARVMAAASAGYDMIARASGTFHLAHEHTAAVWCNCL